MTVTRVFRIFQTLKINKLNYNFLYVKIIVDYDKVVCLFDPV